MMQYSALHGCESESFPICFSLIDFMIVLTPYRIRLLSVDILSSPPRSDRSRVALQPAFSFQLRPLKITLAWSLQQNQPVTGMVFFSTCLNLFVTIIIEHDRISMGFFLVPTTQSLGQSHKLP